MSSPKVQEKILSFPARVRVVAEPEAAAFIRERGGQLFVWATSHRCCRGRFTLLDSSTEQRPGAAYRRLNAAGFDLFLDTSIRTMPDELQVTLHKWPRRHVEVYWNGCAWVM